MNELKNKPKAQLQRVFVEEMKAHRLYGASAFFDELDRRGYTCEFHKRRAQK